MAMTSVSILVFSVFGGLNLVDAVYFTTTIITTIGSGDIHLRDAPTPLKLYGGIFMIPGATALAVSYAFITDALAGARLRRQSGGLPHWMRDHIVVCALGNIGYRVVEQLAGMGIPVVAAELEATDPILALARNVNVPVQVADARQSQTLEALNITLAHCLVVATNDDVANLETAMDGRVLLLTNGDEQSWAPPLETRLAEGQRLIVVTTRRGLSQVLENTHSPAPTHTDEEEAEPQT